MDELKFENILDSLEECIESEDIERLKAILSEIHPADIAHMFGHFNRFEQNYIFDLLPAETASEVLVELSELEKERMLKKLDEERLMKIVDELESDEAADVLAAVEPEVAEKVLDALPDEDSLELRQLLTYDDETAGGIMGTEMAVVHENSTVKEAISEIREVAEDVDDIYTVWVVDAEGVLKGRISLKDLILANSSTLVKEIYQDDAISVPLDMDQEEAAQMVQKYDLVSMPVVDKKGRLVGRITWDDAMEVLNEEASEDMGHISGTGGEEPGIRSVFHSMKKRLPWLITGLFGGVVSAWIMSEYVHSLEALIALTFFIPIITAMGGNVGIQSSSIVVRGLAIGEITYRGTGQRIMKELGVALLNGMILSIILCIVILLWQNLLFESLVISMSLIIVILTAALVGVTAPLMLSKLNIDPALAMGPFVTISNDILGVFIYLFLTTTLLF